MKIIKVLSCLDCPYFLCSEGGDQYCDYLEKDLEDYDLDDINIVPDCPLEDYVESKSCDGCKYLTDTDDLPPYSSSYCKKLCIVLVESRFKDNFWNVTKFSCCYYEPKQENGK